MISKIKKLSRERQDYNRFLSLPEKEKELVFYSEKSGYWVYFEPVIYHLVHEYEQSVTYLTSDISDPILSGNYPGVRPFYIGDGIVRTLLFTGLQVKIMVMTMPDLETFHIKRKKGVHYVYIQHAMVSCHMMYRPCAFDNFDTVFCCGPHHIAEIRKQEELRSLKQKNLVEHGYSNLDTLMAEYATIKVLPRKETDPIRIVIAPSWGPNSLLERYGDDFIEPLLNAGYFVTLRLHPQTYKLQQPLLKRIKRRYGSSANFSCEEDITSKRSLIESDLMICDWSGVALEYAFSRLRPVLFVDAPRKVNNPEYMSLGIEPFEVGIREKIGRVIPESEIMHISSYVEEMVRSESVYEQNIAAIRDASIFNIGNSGRIGARKLMELLNERVSISD